MMAGSRLLVMAFGLLALAGGALLAERARDTVPDPIAVPVRAERPAYRQTGEASWYGDERRGRPTASGTPFDPAGLTAAHRELPLGARATVTNLENGRHVTVEINDRGPHRAGRIIDLAPDVFQQLGHLDAGVLSVTISW